MHFFLGALRVISYHATIFALKISSAFYVCCIYSSAIQTRFFIEASKIDCILMHRKFFDNYAKHEYKGIASLSHLQALTLLKILL